MLNHLLIISSIIITFIIIGFRNPQKYLFFWGVFTIPFSYDYTLYSVQFPGFTGWVHGIIVRLSDIFFLLLYILLSFTKINVENSFIKKYNFKFPIALLIIAFLLSSISAIWRIFSFYEIINIIKISFFYFYIPIKFIKNKSDLKFAINILVVTLFFQAVVGIVQFLYQDYYMFLRTGKGVFLTYFHGLVRSHGTVGQPNGYAGYLLPIILLTLSIVVAMKNKYITLYIIVLVVGMLALVLSFSRAGWIGFIIGSCIVFYMGKRKDSYKTISLANKFFVLVFIFTFLTVFSYKIFYERWTLSDSGAAEDRWYLMQIAFNIIKKNLFFGVGVNNYRFAMYQYVPENYDWPYIYIVHNLYLLVFAETGIIGFIAILLLFYIPCKLLIKNLKTINSEYLPYAIGLLAGFIGSAIQNIVDITWASSICNSLYFLQLSFTNILLNIENNQKSSNI